MGTAPTAQGPASNTALSALSAIAKCEKTISGTRACQAHTAVCVRAAALAAAVMQSAEPKCLAADDDDDDGPIVRGEAEQWKVTVDGRYVRFPGLTFISHLVDHTGLWARLLAALADDAVIASCFAVLPVASLHVTIKNHETAMISAPSRGEWDVWLEAVLLGVMQPTSRVRALMAACEHHNYVPVASVDTQQPAWSAAHSTLRLALHLHNDPEPLRGQLTALGSRAEPDFVFHITLAYRYRRATSQRATVNERLSRAFDAALTMASSAAPLTFAPCRLHYFPNMCEFVALH